MASKKKKTSKATKPKVETPKEPKTEIDTEAPSVPPKPSETAPGSSIQETAPKTELTQSAEESQAEERAKIRAKEDEERGEKMRKELREELRAEADEKYARFQKESESAADVAMFDDLERFRSAVVADALAMFGITDRDAERFADSLSDRLRAPTLSVDAGTVEFRDLRGEQDYDYGGKNKVKFRAKGIPFRRDLSEVDTIVVHQTAVEFGVGRRAIARADGDVELARARRSLDVACHVMVFRQSHFAAAHDFDVYVNHGNRFNAGSLGLEIDGRYPGLEDDPATMPREDIDTTWGGEPTELTDQTVETSKEAIRWMVAEALREGATITKIVSHRQSNDKRRSDPGQGIWQRIVLPIAEELGLEVVTASPWNQGRPVPVAWDNENGIGEY